MIDTRIDFRYLSEADMIAAGVTDMRACMQAMADMFECLGTGDYVMGGANRNSHGIVLDFPETSEFPRMPLAGTDRRFMAMPAYLGGTFDTVGVKWYGSNVANRQRGLPRSIHMFILSDKDSGAPLAVMSGNLLSAYRTGALPGVGASYLARKDSTDLAIIGPGVMNRSSLTSLLIARPSIDTIRVHGRSADSTQLYIDRARTMFPQLRSVESSATLEGAVRGADIVAIATSSPAGVENYPHIEERWIKPGALISSAATISLDRDFVRNRARNIADHKKLYEAYADELPYPAHGLVGTLGVYWNDLIIGDRLDRSTIGDLGEIIAGRAPGRASDDEIILLGLGGMPVEDVAWATVLYRNALERDIGTSLNLWEAPHLA